MQIHFDRFLTLLSLLFGQAPTAASALTPGSNTSTDIALTAGFTNSTFGVPKPPESFDLTFEIGGPKLRITSCLMNAVAALKQLALGEWDGKIIDGTEYRLENYPEVSIVVTTPRRKRNVQARFVEWAICLGVYEMISRRKFEFAQFEMSWEKQVLGWVQVVNHPTRAGSTTIQGQASGSLNLGNKSATLISLSRTIGQGSVNITNVVTMDNADDPAEARLNVELEPYGDTLGVYDVFVPIMSGLTDMAKFPSTVPSSALVVGLEGFKGFICVLPAIPLRTSPPFMEYAWLIRALSRIPTYMLNNGRFGEVNIRIVVDQTLVGFGRLQNRPDCGVDASLPASIRVAQN